MTKADEALLARVNKFWHTLNELLGLKNGGLENYLMLGSLGMVGCLVFLSFFSIPSCQVHVAVSWSYCTVAVVLFVTVQRSVNRCGFDHFLIGGLVDAWWKKD